MNIKVQYDRGMQELRAFISLETSWKDLTKEEFSEKSRFFKGLLVLSNIAMQEDLYPMKQLKEEEQHIKQAIKQLLF